MQPRALGFTLIFGVSSLAGSASAAVTFYDLFKTADYSQTSDAQPVNANAWRFTARIFTDTASDVQGATLTKPDSTVLPFSSYAPQVAIYQDGGYASAADIDTAYPAGNYQYDITSGNLAPASAVLTLNATDYPDSVPYLTGTSFDSLQHVSPGAATPLTWGSFGHAGQSNVQYTYFTVYDLTANSIAFNNSGPDGTYLGDTLPAGTFQQGHSYSYTLFFSSRYEFTNQGFGGATSIAGSDWATSGAIQVVPEPCSAAALALGGLALLRRRKN